MTMTPWTGDACSLVDAFRAGDRSPTEELEATLAAVYDSDLNAFAHVDPDRARAAAESADLTKPFGGVPTAIKELDAVEGWPNTEASLAFKDRISTYTSVYIDRLLTGGGAVPVGQTTASEFGGLNVSVTKLHGVTHNPWRRGRTAGGSSAGSASAVAGGLLSLATGGDGGGSIRIPAAYNGLLGMKSTFGRLPRSPFAYATPNTVCMGNLARSVRDSARFFDVCGGHDARDPYSLPKAPSFEAGLGQIDLAGKRVAVIPGLGKVPLEPGIEDHIRAEAADLIAFTGMIPVDIDLELPNLTAQWMLGNMATLVADLGDLWPECAGDLTDEIRLGVELSKSLFNIEVAAEAERLRVLNQEAMAGAFDQVDFIIAATNPGTAFAAEATTSSPEPGPMEKVIANPAGVAGLKVALGAARVAKTAAPGLPNRIFERALERDPDTLAMGALTLISNLYGNPAVSIPAGTLDGLPVGLQVLGRHHEEALLFDVALAMERNKPWPMVAPSA